MSEPSIEFPTAAPRPPQSAVWRLRVRWFMAEFLVVVTGVLVALGINAWWELQRDHALERSYLQRLAADLHTDSAEFDRHINIERARGDQARLVIAALSGSATRDSQALIRAIEQVGWVTGFQLSPHTFQELQSTGYLRLIRSAQVRSALSAYYYQGLNNQGLQTDYSRDRSWAYARSTAAVLPVDVRVQISRGLSEVDTSAVRVALSKLHEVPGIDGLINEVLLTTVNLERNHARRQQRAISALNHIRGELARMPR